MPLLHDTTLVALAQRLAVGVVVATATALAARGAFADNDSVVLYITGNGYKGALAAASLRPAIAADADDFRAAYADVLA